MKRDYSHAKVSYCITCKGRLHHLKETLATNLETMAGDPNVEFVLLDYASADGLGDWVREHFKPELESGRLVYARHEPAPYFQFSHAKNMAHRLASGEILCNLDADNMLARGNAEWMREMFQKHPKSIIASRRTTIKSLDDPKSFEGICGRIALTRDGFARIGGYDEGMTGRGEDQDLKRRSMVAGMRRVDLPIEQLGSVITHGHDERLVNLRPEDQRPVHGKRTQLQKIDRVLKTIPHHINAQPHGNVGCGEVTRYPDTEPTTIRPLGELVLGRG